MKKNIKNKHNISRANKDLKNQDKNVLMNVDDLYNIVDKRLKESAKLEIKIKEEIMIDYKKKLKFLKSAAHILKELGIASGFAHCIIDATLHNSAQPIIDNFSKPFWMHVASFAMWFSGHYIEKCVNNCQEVILARGKLERGIAIDGKVGDSKLLKVLDWIFNVKVVKNSNKTTM